MGGRFARRDPPDHDHVVGDGGGLPVGSSGLARGRRRHLGPPLTGAQVERGKLLFRGGEARIRVLFPGLGGDRGVGDDQQETSGYYGCGGRSEDPVTGELHR